VNERARPRKEAEALKVEVDLKPCQRVSDQVVKYRYIANRTRGFYVKTQFRTQHSLFAFHFAFDSSSSRRDKSRDCHRLRARNVERRAGARRNGYIAGTE